jgi:vancomycin resistance protein VanW
MELRGGCIVPTVGGGICLISNALFRMACELGWRVIERHGHTMEASPPDPAEPVWGLDATVLWPHVDLRIAPHAGLARLSVRVAGDALEVAVDAAEPLATRVELRSAGDWIGEREGVRIRHNQIGRRIVDVATGRVVVSEVIAENRRRLLHAAEQRRNCLSCDEDACHARPEPARRAAIARRLFGAPRLRVVGAP